MDSEQDAKMLDSCVAMVTAVWTMVLSIISENMKSELRKRVHDLVDSRECEQRRLF